MDNKPRKKPGLSRPLRWGIFLLLVALTLANLYLYFRRTILQRALPYITSELKKYANEEMGADVDWDIAKVDNWGRIVFEGLALKIEGDDEPTAFADRITIGVAIGDILSVAKDPISAISAINLDGVRLRITRDAEGKWNFASLFKPKEPIRPEAFPLRCRIRLRDCSVEYSDPALGLNDDEYLRAANLRGGIDLTDLSDIRIGLLWDVPDATTRAVSLKGRANLFESRIDMSAAGEVDSAKLVQLLKFNTYNAEVRGNISFGLHSSGSFAEGYFDLLPGGSITLSGCGLRHPYFDEEFEDIKGTINLVFSKDAAHPTVKAHSEGLNFTYAGTSYGTGSVRAGWAGEFAYAAELDITSLSTSSIQSLLPAYLSDKLDMHGTVDVSLSVFGTEDGPSMRANIVPAPELWALGIPFHSGEARIALMDKKIFLEKISLASHAGPSVDLCGFLDFTGDPQQRIGCSFTDAPARAAAAFYPPIAEWLSGGGADGVLTYTPSGNGHELDLRIVSDGLETSWGKAGGVTAAISTSPGNFILEGFAAEMLGGRVSAKPDDDGKIRLAVSGLDGNRVAEASGMDGDFSIGAINADGKLSSGPDGMRFDIDFAASDVKWRELDLTGVSGELDWGSDSLLLENIRAVGAGGEVIELSGNLPSSNEDETVIDLQLRDFDIGRLFPEREGAALSRTDAHFHIAGTPEDLSLEASLTEHSLDLLGNRAYTCDPSNMGAYPATDNDSAGPPAGDVVITGRGKSETAPDGGSGLGWLSGVVFSDISISGAIYVGAYPTGLPGIAEYHHSLVEKPLNTTYKPKRPQIKIGGVLGLDGRFEGGLDEIAGRIALHAPTLKLGLQQINDFQMGLATTAATSLALNGEWKYPSGGIVTASGPAGWDPDQGAGFVSLDINVEAAPINEILALAGIDVSNYAAGLFDGGGRISGPIGDLTISDFKIDAREGSRLFGLSLEEGRVEFGLAGGILELKAFEILSSGFAIGGQCRISGNGAIYLEETGLLAQTFISANVIDYRLEALKSVLGTSIPLGGRLDAAINYTKEERRWKLAYDLRLSEFFYGEHTLPVIEAQLAFDPMGGRLEIDRIGIDDGYGGWIEAGGYATLGILSALFNPEMRGDLRYQRIELNLTGRDFDLGFLDGFLPGQTRFAGKLESMDLHIKGKPTAPAIDGIIDPAIGPIAFGGFVIADEVNTHSGTGMVWEDGLLRAGGDLFVRRGDAVANLIGDIDLRPLNPLAQYDPRYVAPENNFLMISMNTPEPMLLEGSGFSFEVSPEDVRIGISSGRKEVDGKWISRGELDVAGKLNIKSGQLDAFKIKFPEGAKSAPPVNYDISVAIGPGCRIMAGNILDATLHSGEVNLYGTPLSPKLSGRVEIAEGKLNFLSRTFTLLPESEVGFSPLFGVNPFLKAEAEIVITQHPRAETGAEPLIITASIEAFLVDIQKGIRFSSNYPYSSDELLAILGYQELFLALEEEGISSAFTSGLYIYPSGLISRYMRDIAGFSRFELTVQPDKNVMIDLEKEVFFDNLLFTYRQTFGEGTNYIWGTKYRFRARSYAGFRYENLDSIDRQDWVYFVEYLMPLK